MKGNLIVIGCFSLGILFGVEFGDQIIDFLGDLATLMLYALILQVGLNIGANGALGALLRNLKITTLMLPIFTILGTLVFSAAASLCLGEWSMADCMAVGSGFGYYSLSSLLIAQLKEASAGVVIASQLGAIALLSNIFREILSLLGAPLYAKVFGRFAPIASAGSTSMDVCLPIISRYSGADLVPIAIIHGMTLDLCVPVLVTFFCGL